MKTLLLNEEALTDKLSRKSYYLWRDDKLSCLMRIFSARLLDEQFARSIEKAKLGVVWFTSWRKQCGKVLDEVGSPPLEDILAIRIPSPARYEAERSEGLVYLYRRSQLTSEPYTEGV